MATIYMEMQGIMPRMEVFDFVNIVQKFSTNKGFGESDTTKYFDQLWKPFGWAATLGFINNKRKPLEGDLKTDTFKYSTINNNGERIFQSLILFTIAKEGYEILKSPSEVNRTIEEYANGGFEIIHSKMMEEKNFFNNPNDYIHFLLDSIEEDENKPKYSQ